MFAPVVRTGHSVVFKRHMMKDPGGSGLTESAYRMHYILRIASAMCFIGHGVFGIITKPIWCNYFAVFGIGHDMAYRLMPVVGTMDISMGLILLFYPIRVVPAWLVIWGFTTASLRPFSGEPFAEMIERAGNFGAPLALLLLAGVGMRGVGTEGGGAMGVRGVGTEGGGAMGVHGAGAGVATRGAGKAAGAGMSRTRFWFSRLDPNPQPDARTFSRVVLCLRIVVFLLLLGHGWLNLIEKKGLLQQYTNLGFSNPANTALVAGLFEILAALAILIRPVRPLLIALFIWKMGTELFYPKYEVFEWIERGGSYGALLALYFALGKNSIQETSKLKKMRKIVFAILLLTATTGYNRLAAQGCVAIRSTGGFCSAGGAEHIDSVSKWQFSANNRYFRSFRHFVGKKEQKQRQKLGTEVINHQYTLDMTLYRLLNPRWSVMLDVPIAANSLSSLYEHSSLGRFTTHSFGVGDIRLAAYAWVVNPVKMPKANVQVGLGLKLPTGSYNYSDYFHLTDSTKRLGPVDQSIQLGDGGTGITLELNAFYNVSHSVGFYGNFYYLSNPREVNGTSTARGGTASASAIKNGSDVMSVPDQWMARAGVNLMAGQWSFSAGVRDECLPVHDLVGGSNGFRRPGYIISAEPGVTYVFSKVSVYAYVPVALVRNRTQSVPDKITTGLTGVYAQGDAAFADYVVNIGMNIRF